MQQYNNMLHAQWDISYEFHCKFDNFSRVKRNFENRWRFDEVIPLWVRRPF